MSRHLTWLLVLALGLACGGGDDDDGGGNCKEGTTRCTEDSLTQETCIEGFWAETEPCWYDQGKLCEDGACVDPWSYGDPVWSTCLDEPRATVESLSDKATYYDDIAARMHIHPQLRWAANVELYKEEVACPGGLTPPCYEPLTPEASATWEDVERWQTGENDGLWSSLYLASQAFRYAVTGESDALDNIEVLLAGEQDRMAITGVPGLFTRQLIPPDVAGIACPADPSYYTVDEEKDDNRWVRVGEDGCVQVVDPETMEWTTTPHCGLDEYAGWCWLDNVSQDEYVGHMFALGAIARLVDDPEIQAMAADMLGQVGQHLMANDLTFVDWDGRLTEHGRLYPMALTDTPGYLAVMAMSFVLVAAEGSDRDDLRQWYDDCLMQRSGEDECLDWPGQTAQPFTEYLPALLLYTGEDSCGSNWNNFSMVLANFHHLLWYERDLATRALLQDALATEAMLADQPRALIEQDNAWFDVMWAAHKHLGPDSDGPDYDAVEDAVCALRQFPASESTPSLDSASLYAHDCEGRNGGSLTADPIPVADRCPHTFLWWGNPYQRETCVEAPWEIHQPGDYLLAYWMARYYGFVGVMQ
jgi:hypothetical protein